MLRYWLLEAVVRHIFVDVPDWAVWSYFALRSRPVNTLRAHARDISIPRETLRRAVQVLAEAGWAYKARVDGKEVVVPWMPPQVEEDILVQLITVRDEIKHYGEWLLRCMLDLMVVDGDYVDNARPAWLVADDLDGKLELDRFYRSARVAFEFQGRQHSEITNLTPTEADLEEQMKRDRIKARICAEEGIRLITVDARELSFATLYQKIGSALPVVPLLEDRPLYRHLARLARSYSHAMTRSGGKA